MTGRANRNTSQAVGNAAHCLDQAPMVVQTLANDIRKYNRRNEPK